MATSKNSDRTKQQSGHKVVEVPQTDVFGNKQSQQLDFEKTVLSALLIEQKSYEQASDLVIIAARPAMGKTDFILSVIKRMAVDMRIPVAMFSLEMANVQLVNRLIVNVCDIPGEKLKSGDLSSVKFKQLDVCLNQLIDAPIYVDDTAALSIFELCSKARRLVCEHGVKMILIDNLQLMNASGMSFGSRQEEVSTISRNLKGLAKELNIPIIALSQFSDLRESGAIEQDANVMCFIPSGGYPFGLSDITVR